MPSDSPKSVRILAYSCAGGDDNVILDPDKTTFLDMAARQKLLARGLSFNPNLVIANGDHIYWDIKTSLNKPFAEYMTKELWPRYGSPLDLTKPMLHPANIETFQNICDYQIAVLYGTVLRSTPSFFLTDDHDYFENDEYDNNLAVMPPDSYGLAAMEQTQKLYYPEFLPEANRPSFLPGTNYADRAAGVNTNFGSIRFGDLLEALLYDCRRFADYKGDHARLLPQWIEEWLISRTVAEDTRHLIHIPSLPFAFSSGKLGDWYPDVLDEQSGKLVTHKTKAGWQKGWFSQHQRLIQAISDQKKRIPMIVQGDFHASAAGSIHRSGELDLSSNPVHVILSGTLGTGDIPFPSSYRDSESKPSSMIGMKSKMLPTEKNGFTIIDIDRTHVKYSMFTWRPPEPVSRIETMKPDLVYEVKRNA